MFLCCLKSCCTNQTMDKMNSSFLIISLILSININMKCCKYYNKTIRYKEEVNRRLFERFDDQIKPSADTISHEQLYL